MIKKGYGSKAYLVFFCLLILFFVIIVRIFFLQFVAKERLIEHAKSQHNLKKILYPARGSIFDTNGAPLGMTIEVYTVKAVPIEIKNLENTISVLSKILNIRKSLLRLKLHTKKKSIYIKRKLGKKEYNTIKALKLPGIYFDKEFKRIYPKGSLASHVIGFAGMDSTGLEGIEMLYNEDLKGMKGYKYSVKDAKSSEILGLKAKTIDKRDGYDIYLTLDQRIQYITEKEIKKVYDKYNPLSVSAIVMNPKTGYILAAANLPNYDPNYDVGDNLANVRNRLVTDIYEPGSTFKIVALAGALDDGVVMPEEKIYCEKGSFKVRGRRRPLHDHKPHGWLTVKDVLRKSSNIGTSKIAIRLGQKRFYEYIKLFGFGKKTGIDLPGEQPGYARDVKDWTDCSVYAVAMGQEIGVTALQLVSAMSAIANNGILMKPMVVKEIKDQKQGIIIKRFEPEPLRRVISEETAYVMSEILAGVVEEGGTAKRARLKNIRCAGKTGTAQKFDFKLKKYSNRKYIASFVGFFPVEDPEICILVVVNEPPYSMRYGGLIAGPVFKNIAEGILELS
jgi:cell division protein FtsI (penicillin-binding protein 3)